ncbi:MAG: hydrolase [Chromatiaceae bacterium]
MGQLKSSSFRPAWWLPGAHAQTLWPSLFRRRQTLRLGRTRVELADGDFIDLATTSASGPRVLVIHGLEGDLRSHYAAATVAALTAAGFRPVFMHLRGCSGEPNRLARSYHSGATEDLVAVLDHLARTPEGPAAAAVGFSLGGNLLLKHLGESDRSRLQAAVAVSVPFVLRDAMLRLGVGASRLYQRYLLGRLKSSYRAKFARLPSPLTIDLEEIGDFFDYDDRVTAPLNGFAGADEYYGRCSCRPLLHHIRVNTLILHAADDPFMFRHTVPGAAELGPGVILELAEHGGHVGFVSGLRPWRPRYWLDDRILEFLRDAIGSPAPAPRPDAVQVGRETVHQHLDGHHDQQHP